MTRAQVTGRGRDPTGCCRCSESVWLHCEPRQQRRWYVDGSGRPEISAIHYPQRGKLWKEIVHSDRPPIPKKPVLAIIMSLVFQAIQAPFQPSRWPIKYNKKKRIAWYTISGQCEQIVGNWQASFLISLFPANRLSICAMTQFGKPLQKLKV